MKIAFVTPEMHPFSKTGGLADISYSLPRALADRQSNVTVFTPFYSHCRESCKGLNVELEQSSLPNSLWIGSDREDVTFFEARYDNLNVVFVANDKYFKREHLYTTHSGADYSDNLARYSYFCRAVLEYCLLTGEIPDIFHANDWQSGLLPVYLRTTYNLAPFHGSRTLFSVHNMGYQGRFNAEEIYSTGLDWTVFTPDMLEFYGNLCLLKGGIVFADAVATVSPTYAKEIQTEEYGMGLDGVTSYWQHKIHGILNGISTELWNPETDPFIAENYSQANLRGKAACKADLQAAFQLPASSSSLLVGVVSRLEIQKGIDLILAAFPKLSELDLQLVILGTGNRELEHHIKELQQSYPGQFSAEFTFSEELAHKVEAGADAFLMPSAYEPCGLNQMYSMRYGTIPIVRETGGLHDTVRNFTPRRLATGTATGFTFRKYEVSKLIEAVQRAARTYFGNQPTWRKLIRNCMLQELSWDKSARAYLNLYGQMLKQPRTTLQGSLHG